MRALVTGAAGFIGSTLSNRLLGDDWTVRGVDNFAPYYDVALKRANASWLASDPGFELVERDLLTADLAALLDGTDVVFHLAAQPGVRMSWADGFDAYVDANVRVTQRLLEAARDGGLTRFVYASSSSVYGQITRPEVSETDPLHPFSPYGVTKLAGEHLCTAYGQNYVLPTVALRFFTVYGPRQRPDMALHRLIRSAQSGEPFPLYGTGEQIRDFTFVDDVVDANVRAATVDLAPGAVFNVSGGSQTRLSELIDLVGTLTGRPVPIDRRGEAKGDVTRTGGSNRRAREVLGWEPVVGVEEGVARQIAAQSA